MIDAVSFHHFRFRTACSTSASATNILTLVASTFTTLKLILFGLKGHIRKFHNIAHHSISFHTIPYHSTTTTISTTVSITTSITTPTYHQETPPLSPLSPPQSTNTVTLKILPNLETSPTLPHYHPNPPYRYLNPPSHIRKVHNTSTIPIITARKLHLYHPYTTPTHQHVP